MSPKIKTVFILIHFLLAILCAKSSLAVDDTIIAIVNDDVITMHDLRDYYQSIYLQFLAEGMPQEKIQKEMTQLEQAGLDQLIEDRLIIQAAKKAGIEIRDTAIDERLEDIKQRYPSEQDFLDALTQDGTTITDIRNKIQERFFIQYIVDIEVRSKIFVNPQEVTDYYNSHLDQFKKAARVNLNSIFIPFKDVLRDEARQKAFEAMELLKKGENFEEVATQFSASPSIGVVTKGELLPKIEEKVFALNVIGEISPTIETETGIFIFQLKGKLEGETVSLPHIKDEIYNSIFQMKFKEKYYKWLEKLKNQSYVEIKK